MEDEQTSPTRYEYLRVAMFVFGGEACAIQPEVRYFRTSNRIFPGSFVSRPLVKGNEDPGYEGGPSIVLGNCGSSVLFL